MPLASWYQVVTSAAGDFQNIYHNMADIGLQQNGCSNMPEFQPILANREVIAVYQDAKGLQGGT